MTTMALSCNEIPSKTISAVTFTCYSGNEIRALSEKKATNPHSLDSLQHPTDGGLYDAAYGPVSLKDVCATCGLGAGACPGHLGHIELPLPIYHPLFFKTLYDLVRGSCLHCKQLLISREVVVLLSAQLEALEKGLVQTVYHLKNAINEAKDYQAYDKSEEIAILDKIYNRLHDMLEKDATAMEVSSGDAKNLSNGKRRKDWSRHAADLHDDILCEFKRLLAKSVSKCPHCKATAPTMREEHKSKIFYMKKDINGEQSPKYMTPTEVRNHINELWKKESRILSKVMVAMTDTEKFNGTHEQVDSSDKSSAVDVFFLDVLSVPPSRFRPMNIVKDQQYESTQTTAYAKIIVDCSIIRCIMKKISEMDAEAENDESGNITISTPVTRGSMDLVASMPGATLPEKLMNAWHRLQQHVSGLFDGDLDRMIVNREHRPPGLKQLLEKKGGLFRQNMMGKRVNYAARSVISPDPYIATNEIGIPLVFASKLTYPTPVTPWNVSKLRKAVINGPLVYPGATHVISDGRTIRLSPTDETQRHAMAKQLIASYDTEPRNNRSLPLPKQVLRHIQTGDVMLLNRQPTLHKGSIMGHKVRVLPGEKTLRLHYANCKSYNADFDGDEMNAHFPQTELARAEAMHLMLTDEQYLSAKDGKPLSSLIQDHMVAGVNMCLRGRFFRREEYHLLLYNALAQLPRKIKLLPPTIMKPAMLWSGKQVISTLLINVIPDGLPLINLVGKSKIGAKHWQTHVGRPPATAPIEPGDMCESQVVVRQGELLCGILDKAHYGATEFGLVHATYELYGGEISGRLLSCLARLFTVFLQFYKGFTLGVEDILVTTGADEQRSEIIQENLDGMATVARTLNVKHKNNPKDVADALWDAHVATKLPTNQSEDKLAAVDHAMKKISNAVNDQVANHCTGDGLLKPFPDNNLQLMVISGAKGGMVNCMQISCLLGQIELEGRRPPLMPSGRSVPSFKPYCTSLRSGGFISQRFLTGIRPQEYFHHCMAGREGLVDTAVKTSRSGYLQRSLIKHLEGLLLAYDMTVRDSDGGVLQFMYGEDGIDVTKSAYLQQKQCKFAVDNFDAIKRQLPSMETIESVFDTSSARRKWKKYNKLKKKRDRYIRRGGAERPRNSAFLEFEKACADKETSQIIEEWRKLPKEEQAEYSAKVRKYYLPDPVISQLRPDLYFGSTSDHFHDEMRQYLHRNPDKLSADDDVTIKGLPSLKGLEDLLSLRYQKALCQPGEGVGLLAAQSIGEPSTQMTLNTFHFAGRGEMNVTLGIPRLREILMVASKQIKTPQVTVPVLDGMTKRARRLCKELTKVLLSQVLHKFTLEETLVVEHQSRHRRCVLSISILPEQQFQKDMALSRNDVLRHIERRFISQLVKSIAGKLKKREADVLLQGEKKETKKRETKEKDESEETPLDAEMNYEEDEDQVQNDADEEKEDEDEMEYEDNEDEVNDDMEMVEEGFQASSQVVMEDDSQEMVNKIPYPEEATPRLLAVKSLRSGEVFVEDYEFDVTANGWCKITLLMPLLSVNVDLASLVRECASVSSVRKVPGLVRSILVPAQGKAGEEGVVNLVTEGINFYKMFENEDSLDVDRLYCNCVHSVARMYGIEAARCVVVKEIANVFAVYGIQVDRRHLTMIADYMCYEGTYKPFNRSAMRSCVSPLQQMTFETTVNFLNHAALHGLPDDLKSPSSRIVTGQVVNCGTGNFSLVFPVADFA